MANKIYKVILKHTESLDTATIIADENGKYSSQLEYGQAAVVSKSGDESLIIKNTDGKLVQIGGKGAAGSTKVTAGNGITAEPAGDGSVKVSAKAKQNDTVITVDAAGIQSTITMKREGNFIIINGANNAEVAKLDLTDLIISGVLIDAQVKTDPDGMNKGTYLYLKWKVTNADNSTSEKETYIDVTKLIPVFTGSDCIEITDNANGSKAISLKVTGNDKVLEQTGTGLGAIVDLEYDKTAQLIKLLGKAGSAAPIATIDCTNFIVEGLLKDATLEEKDGKQYINLTWNTSTGDKTFAIDVTALMTLYKAGDGLQLDEATKTFSAKIDGTGEDYLSVGPDGLKLSGVTDAINKAVQDNTSSVNLANGAGTTITENTDKSKQVDLNVEFITSKGGDPNLVLVDKDTQEAVASINTQYLVIMSPGIGTTATFDGYQRRVNLNVDLKVVKPTGGNTQLQLLDHDSNSTGAIASAEIINGIGTKPTSDGNRLRINLSATPSIYKDVNTGDVTMNLVDNDTYANVAAGEGRILIKADEEKYITINTDANNNAQGIKLSDTAKQAIDYYAYYTGHNTATEINDLPVDKHLVIVTMDGDSQSHPFKLHGDATLDDGKDLHVLIHNTNANNSIVVTFDEIASLKDDKNNAKFVIVQGANVTIEPSNYAEINIISDGSTGYLRYSANQQ